MKTLKKALAAVTAIILILLSLTHCAPQSDGTETASTSAVTGSSAETDRETQPAHETESVPETKASETHAPETGAPVEESVKLTAEEEKTLQNAVRFILRMYYYAAGGLSNDDDLAYRAAEMFPDKVRIFLYGENGEMYESKEGDIRNYHFEMDLTENELLEFARAEWPYMSDRTLNDKIVSMIVKRGGINWGNAGGHGMGTVINGESGTYAGYTADKNTVSVYYTYKLTVYSVFDEWSIPYDYEEQVEAHNGEDFTVNGYDLTADENGKYILKDYRTRVFRFSLTDDGRAEYISDEWNIVIPFDTDICS